MFKECPHPDEKQRMQLSRELGLAPRQIKFWFQNRRTQMKVLCLFSLLIYFEFMETYIEFLYGFLLAMIMFQWLFDSGPTRAG